MTHISWFMEKIISYLQTHFELSQTEVEIFLSSFTPLQLKKKDLFLEMGKTCQRIGLIQHGLMVCSYNQDGKEIVDEFAYEPGFVTNYYSFLSQTPSLKEIRCVEDCDLYVISRQKLAEMGKNYPFLERMSRKVSEQLFLRSQERICSLLLDSATLRYQKLVAFRSDLAKRIPQYLLAAYLNVKPETVSRIRKKLTKQAVS